MKIDINKKYRTRDGGEVTNLHRAPFDWPSDCYPWRGLIDGNPATWNDNGQSWEQIGTPPNSDDLIEVREPREWTLAIHPNGIHVSQYCTQGGNPKGCEVVQVREISD